jgi:translocation protein SEC62
VGSGGPSQQPTPEQIAAMRAQIEAEAAKHNMSPQDYYNMMRAKAMKQAEVQQQRQQQQQQKQAGHAEGHEHQHDHPHEHTGEQQVPINPGEPTPQALALQKWLRSQDLKSRSCVLNDQRKDMFKGTSLRGG